MASPYVHVFICSVELAELAVNSWSELGSCVSHQRDSCVFSDPVSVTGNTLWSRAIAADSIDSIGQDGTRSNLIGLETGTRFMVVFKSALTVKNVHRKVKTFKLTFLIKSLKRSLQVYNIVQLLNTYFDDWCCVFKHG